MSNNKFVCRVCNGKLDLHPNFPFDSIKETDLRHSDITDCVETLAQRVQKIEKQTHHKKEIDKKHLNCPWCVEEKNHVAVEGSSACEHDWQLMWARVNELEHYECMKCGRQEDRKQ